MSVVHGGARAPALGAARAWRVLELGRLRHHLIGLLGATIILATILTVVAGPRVWRIDYADESAPRLLAPSAAHPLGTDTLGRDELSRIVHGAQVSLQVGMIAVLIACVLGTAIGILTGFYRRGLDAVLMRVSDDLHRDSRVSDTTWDAILERFGLAGAMSAVFTASSYRSTSMSLNAYGVQLEPGDEGFPYRAP